MTKNRLLVLASATVVAVYAAGYERTRAAAQRFAGDDTERRQSALPVAEQRVEAPTAAAAAAKVREAPARNPAPRPADAGATGHRSTVSGPATPPSVPSAARTADTSTVVASPVVVAPLVAPPAAPLAVPPSAPPPLKVDSAVTTAPVKHAETAATQPQSAQWKDGTYSGWGTSRHGDIQATLVIDGGHIVSAWIERCLTRYSCSWISHLPPQVVVRQSPDVDFVSGATQSTNAFYYAVQEALSKAK